MHELTYVTCLFDLSQYRRTPTGERNALHYLKYAKSFILRVDMPIYIFTSHEFYHEIYNFRKSLNLEDKTYIHIVNLEDLPIFRQEKLRENYNIILEYYNSINKWCTVKFIPEYIYLILSKFYFLKKASVDNIFNTKNIAWIDFGINHREKIDPRELNPGILLDIESYTPQNLTFPIFTQRDIPENVLLKQWNSVSAGGFIIMPVNKHPILDTIMDKINQYIKQGYLVYDETMLYAIYKNPEIECCGYLTSSNYDKILVDYINFAKTKDT